MLNIHLVSIKYMIYNKAVLQINLESYLYIMLYLDKFLDEYDQKIQSIVLK